MLLYFNYDLIYKTSNFADSSAIVTCLLHFVLLMYINNGADGAGFVWKL